MSPSPDAPTTRIPKRTTAKPLNERVFRNRRKIVKTSKFKTSTRENKQRRSNYVGQTRKKGRRPDLEPFRIGGRGTPRSSLGLNGEARWGGVGVRRASSQKGGRGLPRSSLGLSGKTRWDGEKTLVFAAHR